MGNRLPDCSLPLGAQVKLNGKTVVPTDEWGWPDRIPEEGNLQLRFDTVMAPPGNAEPMQDENFENIRKELYNVGANDQWRLTVLRLVCGTHYFTSHQANVLVRCCSWSRERVEACTILFGRIVDPQNIDRFTAALSRCGLGDEHGCFSVTCSSSPAHPRKFSLRLSTF